MPSPVRVHYSTESKAKSEEPLAQKLNINEPESGDLRAKTQAFQSKVENMTEPPTTEQVRLIREQIDPTRAFLRA